MCLALRTGIATDLLEMLEYPDSDLLSKPVTKLTAYNNPFRLGYIVQDRFHERKNQNRFECVGKIKGFGKL